MNKYLNSSDAQQRFDVDSILSRLLDSNGAKIAFSEQDIRELVNTCKYILVEQPILLELQAPVKVVGKLSASQATSTASIPIY
jgi:serine/threonine-protein phosphatase PP1 catalytic subunit